MSVRLQGQQKSHVLCLQNAIVAQYEFVTEFPTWLSAATSCYFCFMLFFPMTNSSEGILYTALAFLPSA